MNVPEETETGHGEQVVCPNLTTAGLGIGLCGPITL